MPNRILRDGILGSRAVNSLSDSAEIFYRRLMSVVDDYGRFEADLELIRARCFPRQLDRWPLSRVSEALTECGVARSSDGVPLLVLYRVHPSIEEYLQINNFGQRIRVDKRGVQTPSKYPSPSLDREAPPNAASSGDSPPKAYALAETLAKTQASAGPTVRAVLPIIRGESQTPDEQAIVECSERMYGLHPKKKNVALVVGALCEAVGRGHKLETIEACHRAHTTSAEWKKESGRFCPQLAAWIADDGFTKWPPGMEPKPVITQKWRPYDPETLEGMNEPY